VKVPVIWPARDGAFRARGYADCALLEQILDRTIWTARGAYDFEHNEVRDDGDWPDTDGAVVIFNGRANVADADWLIERIDRLDWAVVIITGDEEWEFPWRRLPPTDRRKVWVMAPTPDHSGLSWLIPGGWYWDTREDILAASSHAPTDRPLLWFFAGQVTHVRRTECVNALEVISGGEIVATDGFMRGLPPAEYAARLTTAKIVPCPSGPVTIDTARPLSAMEAGCVPILDTRKPRDPQFDYWELIFGPGHPIPTIARWGNVGRVICDVSSRWSSVQPQVSSFWQQWKRRTAQALHDHIREVRGDPPPSTPGDIITVVITTSPIPSHPSTEILEATIQSVRDQLPHAEIIVAIDGVRPEQVHMAGPYEEYVQRVLWNCNFHWHNVLPVVMPSWGHQANATRLALEFVHTPVILFVEHDTPILGDIPWADLAGFVTDGMANAIRLHQDVEIHPDHERVMVDHETRWVWGVPARRTMAWWQRPHLASTDWYRAMLDEFFHPDSRTMIEDRLYGIMWVDCVTSRSGWDRWKVWVYTPDGDMRRSGHLDGRGDQPKFDMVFEPRGQG